MAAIHRFVVTPSNVWPGLRYNVQVVTSVDGGESFWYCGNGRFCRNLTEVFQFVIRWNEPRREGAS